MFAAELPDGKIVEIKGSIFGQYEVTQHPIRVSKLLAPVQPPTIFCIGLNYRRHAEETGAKIPAHPVVFMKAATAVQNPNDPIEIPTHLASSQVDFEAELAVIIGKRCKNVSKAHALEYVFGYTCANDVSARDWQKDWGGSQWCRGKTFDTFCPLGPCITPREEIPNPQELTLRAVLDNFVMQEASTNDMIFDVATLIEFLSGSTTLLPGTVILTGTPSGVGMARDPQVFLKSGDRIHIEIEGIGKLSNPVVDEPRDGRTSHEISNSKVRQGYLVS